jgi:DNA-binding beta-propeller fold protein YncE
MSISSYKLYGLILGLLGTFLIGAVLYALGGTADHVVGQINFTNRAADFVDGHGLSGPIAVAVDPIGGQVYVADYNNNRVLGWKNSQEFSGNQPADLVIGQPDFYSSYCNQNPLGTTAAPGIPAANTLCGPQGLAVDQSENVYVADTANNRVLTYSNPFALGLGQTTNFDAIEVFGQGSNGSGVAFTLNACGLSAIALCSPKGVAIDSNSNLFVLDAVNNRVVEYFDPSGPVSTSGTGDVTADFVLGQANFTSNSQFWLYTSEYGAGGSFGHRRDWQ